MQPNVIKMIGNLFWMVPQRPCMIGTKGDSGGAVCQPFLFLLCDSGGQFVLFCSFSAVAACTTFNAMVGRGLNGGFPFSIIWFTHELYTLGASNDF